MLSYILTALVMLAAQQSPLAERVRQGNDLMAAGQYARAAAVYSELVKLEPKNASLRANLGMALHLAGHDREAIREFETALRQQPDIAPAQLMMGASWLRLGEPEKAVPPLRKALAADLAETHPLLAQALAALGQHEAAIEHYRRWTATDRGNPKAWHGLGRACEALAREAFAELERSAPESGYMLALVAAAQASAGRDRSAFYLYREALKREPRLRGVHAAIAELYRKTGHADWAAREQALEPKMTDPYCTTPFPGCDFLVGRYERAATRQGSDPQSLYWRARALAELAREAFARLEQLPASAEQHAVRAAELRDRGRHRESIEEWRKALQLALGEPAFEKELATTLRLNEDHSAARAIVEKLLQRDSRSAELHYLLGHILLDLQQPGAAVPHLAKAVELEPSFLPARSALGLALAQLGRDGEALPHLKAAAALDRDGSLHFRLARVYQKLAQAEAAQAALARYRELQARSEAQRKQDASEFAITPP
ncbi:MAG TPA: tetratricopeptide repeat protein [Bryobacteraceae bacterium]|nr:tetratricopeptide repeat protein [Bryobacteraceae bacterium]